MKSSTTLIRFNSVHVHVVNKMADIGIASVRRKTQLVVNASDVERASFGVRAPQLSRHFVFVRLYNFFYEG